MKFNGTNIGVPATKCIAITMWLALAVRLADVMQGTASMRLVAMAALLLLLPFAGMTQEQNERGASISITASATVMPSNIELITISDMGILDAQLLQNGDTIYINPVMDPEAGIMRAHGQPNSEIRVSYLPEEQVTRREGPGSLVFVYEVSGFPGDSQRESELLDQLERELRFNEEGVFYFYIGGYVDLSDALPGNYDGEFTIEIEYI